jgi:signal transduction histidine kinase/CheY-like chemotaxis protein
MVRVLDAVASVGQAILRRRLEGAAWQVPLEILGQAVEPDRVYVFHNHPHPQTQEPACSQTAEWVAGGVAAQIDLPDLQNICWKDFSPRWQQTLSAGQALFGEVASFPASERDLLEMQGIQSILVVPIFSREQWWGFMGFDYCRRTRKWLSAEVALLMSAAASIGLRLAQQEDENRLKQAMESANAANAAKSRFLSTMSHEIRTPLNSILGYTQLLRRNNQLNPPERVQLETIYRSGQHLLTLINDILDISKIEAGRVNLNASEFDLRDFAQEVMEMLQARASAKGIATRISISVADRPLQDNQSLLVRADIKALRQVLVNLVGNAVKFTDQGEVALEIYVEQKKSAVDCVTFRVVDSGIGIPQQELGRLFAAFSQLHHDNRGEHGTGLGLAIAKGMIELMHGTIEVESRENHGSVFYFTIPMPCKLVERVLPALCNSPIAAGPEVIQGYIGKRRSVLIVDDVMENRALLSDLLKPLGFQLTEATNGREALAMLNNSPFDVVLTDIVMPFMDGREFARQAKRLPAIAGIPIIAITASVIQDARNRNPADACFSAFVRKPVNLDELLRVMEEQLELEWDTSRPVAAPPLPVAAEAASDNSPLSLSQLRRLYELASIGDVDALRQQLSTHSSQHPQVIEPLIDLLNHYALNAICKRLEERLHKATS